MDRIPGTQRLVDLANKGLDAGTQSRKGLLLQPRPSSSPDDPLNWAPRRKAVAITCVAVFTFFNGFAGSNLYSVLEPLSEESGLSLSTLNAGTGYLFLLAALGLLIWQPFALQYGKRPVYMISLLGMLATSVWGAFITTRSQWYARSVITGFFASPVEALPEASVADVFFVHERGSYMSIYAAALVGSNFFAPIICGFINDGQGYEWVFYWSAIFCGVGTAFLFFAMEETNFDRYEDACGAENVKATSNPSSADKRSQVAPPRPCSRARSYFAGHKLIETHRPFVAHQHLKRQILFLAWPIPVFSGFAGGSVLIWYNVLNATSSAVLSAAPYNFSSSIVGLSYIAGVVGVALGFLVTGPLSDYLIVCISRRYNGTFEPEYRLWLFIFPLIFIPSGLILWGIGSANEIHWIGLLFALGFLAFQNACGASLSVTYLVDCYREMAGDALTALSIIKNVMSFAVSYGINPWIEGMGTRRAFGLAAGIGVATCLMCLSMIFFGKALRKTYTNKYWRLVQRSGHELK